MGHERMGEKCAVVGVYVQEAEAARIAFFMLHALQHRGQEASGITSSDHDHLKIYKGLGLVSRVFGEEEIGALTGDSAIGHNRYSTFGGAGIQHAQPILRIDSMLALGHNGNLPTTDLLQKLLKRVGVNINNKNDSEMITDAINFQMQLGASPEDAIIDLYPLFTGAFSMVMLTNDKIIGVRDSNGMRPLSIGQLNGGYLFASETCALNTVGAIHLRDVNPGEMVVVDSSGLHAHEIVCGEQRLDIFEFVYFARPDSNLLGKNVYESRKRMGVQLAREFPVEADIVIGVPDSAVPAAIGFSKESHIEYEEGVTKNRYIQRTFIVPDPHMRKKMVELKLQANPAVVKGKRVILIDDSIVRGNTMGQIVKMLKDAGAKEVHVRITSPPVLYPDFYGIDTPAQKELIAATKTLSQMRNEFGATSLEFLSMDGLIWAIDLPREKLSTSCFTGVYPIDIGPRANEVEKVIFKRN